MKIYPWASCSQLTIGTVFISFILYQKTNVWFTYSAEYLADGFYPSEGCSTALGIDELWFLNVTRIWSKEFRALTVQTLPYNHAGFWLFTLIVLLKIISCYIISMFSIALFSPQPACFRMGSMPMKVVGEGVREVWSLPRTSLLLLISTLLLLLLFASAAFMLHRVDLLSQQLGLEKYDE